MHDLRCPRLRVQGCEYSIGVTMHKIVTAQIGHVPGTTAFEYSVSREGREIGRVRLPRATALIDSGQEPQDWIARRLTEVEKNEGPEKLASALQATLEM